jgi:hypothetical protein
MIVLMAIISLQASAYHAILPVQNARHLELITA